MILCTLALLLAGGLIWPSTVAAAAPPPFTTAERALVIEALGEDPDLGEAPPAATDDDSLWRALVDHAAGELGQRVKPQAVDPMWSIAPRPRQVEAELLAAREAGRLGSWLQGLRPAAPGYRALATLRRRYARIVDNGGWPAVPDGPTLRLGATGPMVAALRARLAVEGRPDLGAAAPADSFDLSLEAALTAFQRRHGLQPDGVLGARTLAELNVPAAQRLAQIDANLERWRWLPPLPAERLEVDVAAAEATLYRSNTPQLAMRVVVGDPRHRTPMFISRLDGVIFNPPWKVPTSIAAKELLPKEARDPGYLARNGFSYVDGALQQQPGPKNALGRVKFDLPSPFGVYLHDTPGRAAFERPQRALSHGCIRLEKPRELAVELLAAQDWTPESIDAAIDAGATLKVGMARTLPLYVLYWTAVAEPDGTLQFRPDVYGWDAKLTQALAAARPAAVKLAVREDTECAAAKLPQPLL